MTITIEALVPEKVAQYDAHFSRHRAESGRGDYHFMPFEPDDPEGPRGLDPRMLELPLDDVGWQRWWVARPAGEDRVIGHVDLKGQHLKAALHRCELGIGIERAWRGQGLGRKLMAAAIDFARDTPSIEWVDLRVFGHNLNARALYQALGFEEVGLVRDLVRIEGESIDDVMMTLNVS